VELDDGPEGAPVDAVATSERHRTLERRKLYAALALCSVSANLLLFFKYPAGDIVMIIMPWYEHILAQGRLQVFSSPFGNYTPPYLYLLSIVSLLDGLMPTFYLIKCLAWVGGAWLVFATYRLLQALDADPKLSIAVAFLPSIAANTSLLGQADTFWVAPCVFALAAAVRERWIGVAVWSGLAFAFKAQAVVFAPFVLHTFLSRRVPFRLWLVAPAVYVLAMLPAWLMGWPALDLATIYVRQAQWQPDIGNFISNGASWWTIYGWLSPSVALQTFWIGFVLALSAVLVLLILVPPLGRRHLVAAAVISAAGLPFLLPGMHERFFLLADVLAFVYALAYPSRRAIATAIAIQIASALPVFVWAFELQPLELVAPPLAFIAILLFAREFLVGEPIEFSGTRKSSAR
jgi:Gpi18-like mannosyltransferase